MKKLHIDQTDITPLIDFNPSGELRIEGRSLPENPYEFYMPVRAWLLEYIKNPAEKTTFYIKVPYYNSSSSKFLLTFFKIIETIYKNGHKAEIQWFIKENEDADELEIFKDLISVPFKIIKI